MTDKGRIFYCFHTFWTDDWTQVRAAYALVQETP